MAAKTVVELVRGLYPERTPSSAGKTPSGAVEVSGKKATEDQGEPNYLPILIVGIGVLAVVAAMLAPGVQLGQNADLGDLQGQEQSPQQNQRVVMGWDGPLYG